MIDVKFEDIENAEEIELHKNKKRADRIGRTKNKIRSRKKKILDIYISKGYIRPESKYSNIADGYFENNSICNIMLGERTKVKTKSKHGCQVYRHHNIYGKAIRYANHDLKQIANLKYELKDNNMKHYIKGAEKV